MHEYSNCISVFSEQLSLMRKRRELKEIFNKNSLLYLLSTVSNFYFVIVITFL